MKNRHLSRILAVAMLASCAMSASCGSTPAGTSDSTAEGDTSAEITKPSIDDFLPTADYNGETFAILNNSFTYAEYRIDAASQTGDIFNDAVYDRTRKVEEKLNVKIEVTDRDYWSDNAVKEITNAVMAGDNVYDCVFLGVQKNVSAITSGIYMDLKQIDEFDFTQPWWDTTSMKYYEINDKLYTAHNDTSANIHDSIWTCFFNKKILENNKLEDIYELVNSGKWTLDKMQTMIEATTSDLNGDNAMGPDDQWGLMTHNGAIFGFMHGANISGIDIKDGTPYICQVDDHMFGAFTKIQKMYTSAGTMTNDKHQNTFGFTCVDGFAQNKSLFLVEVLGNAAKLRNMDTDFGIVPYPKYDENQDDYISYYSPAANGLCIPNTCTDTSRVGTVIEVMSAYGYETVRPAYYDVVLNGKTIRDDESAEMLDIIFANIECEMAYLYQWGGYSDVFKSGLAGTTDMVSALEGKKNAAQAAIDTFIENTSKMKDA